MEGGEGNRVGWMEDGEGGACFVGDESGNKMMGWKGETGEGDGLLGDGGEGHEAGGGSEGEKGSKDEQGAAKREGGCFSEGKQMGDNCSKHGGAEGGRSGSAADGGLFGLDSGSLAVVSVPAASDTSGGTPTGKNAGSADSGACFIGEAGGTRLATGGPEQKPVGSWRISLSRAVF